jgi:hypothetical protein
VYEVPEGERAKGTKSTRVLKGLMIVIGRLDFISILDLASQFCGGVDQGGKTLRADIDSPPLVLQGHQGDFLFGSLAIQACFHNSLHFQPGIIKSLLRSRHPL